MHKTHVTVRSSDAGFLSGVDDIVQSFIRTPLWITLGWYDFELQYRRAFIGPLWEVIIVAVWVAGLGLLFGRLLGDDRGDYLVYMGAGVVLWQYISSTLTTGANVFVANSRQIVSINNPLFTYVLRNVIEHLVKFSIHSLVFIAVMILTRTPVEPVMLLAVPGFAILVVTTLWAVPLLGFIGTRFRDFTHLLRAGIEVLILRHAGVLVCGRSERPRVSRELQPFYSLSGNRARALDRGVRLVDIVGGRSAHQPRWDQHHVRHVQSAASISYALDLIHG